MSVILIDSPLCVYPWRIEVFPILIDASIWLLFGYRHKKRQNIEVLYLGLHKGFPLDLIGIPVKLCRTLPMKLETRWALGEPVWGLVWPKWLWGFGWEPGKIHWFHLTLLCSFGVFFTWNTKPNLRALSSLSGAFLSKADWEPDLRIRLFLPGGSVMFSAGSSCPKLASAPSHTRLVTYFFTVLCQLSTGLSSCCEQEKKSSREQEIHT